ncbi:MAG: DUF4349 domain-containing protein [Hyphomonadaceae bacterium]
MRALILSLVLAFGAFGCGQPGNMMSNGSVTADAVQEEAAQGFADTAPPSAPAADMDARGRNTAGGEAAAEPGTTATPGGPNAPAPILYLAYAYTVLLEVPADRLAGIMDAHAQACTQAGPRLCQLIGSNRTGDPDSRVTGALQIRAEPQWLASFRGRLEGDAETAGGRMRAQSTSTEDLTRAIVDTEARLRAMRTLRDRLQQMLASRPGRLSDLLEVERELARVQAEIDATESNLAVMRTRVAMSELTVNYESTPRAVASDTFEPLTNAFAGFLGLIVMGFAWIVSIVAVLLPWALVLGLIAWIVLRVRRARGGRLFRRNPPRETDAPPPA